MVERVRYNRKQWIRLSDEGTSKSESESEVQQESLSVKKDDDFATSNPSSVISSPTSETHQDELKFPSDVSDKTPLTPSPSNQVDRLRTPEENPIVGIVVNDRNVAIVNRRDKSNHDI